MARPVIGVIGGSGLYDLPGLEKVQREVVYRDKLTTTFNVDYAHDAGHLLSRWAILIGFTLLFALGTAWAQARWSRQRARR